MLLRLMGGVALPAGELARAANIAPQTASGHLGRMVEGGLLCVECQGRHRYYRLANDQVGDAIEALLRLTVHPQHGTKDATARKAEAGTLAYARTCYSHLAGWLGVAIAECMERQGILAVQDAKTYTVTPKGSRWFEMSLSVEVPSPEPARRKTAGRCLDWTERRHHLSGVIGCAMCKRLAELKWVVPMRGTRAVRVSVEGKTRLWELLRLPLG
jgi:predicted transcriptional regulator